MLVTHKSIGKFQPKWEGPLWLVTHKSIGKFQPFIIEFVYSNEAYQLAKPDGKVLMAPINDKFLKNYYPQKFSVEDSDNK